MSDWSDDEASQEDPGSKLNAPGEGDHGLREQMLQKEDSEGSWFDRQVVAAHNWVADQKEGLAPQTSPHSVARLTSKVEGQLEAAGGLGLQTQRTTEYQVFSVEIDFEEGSCILIKDNEPKHAGDQRSVVDASVSNQLLPLPADCQWQLES